MSKDSLIALAAACSEVRTDIGRVLLAREATGPHDAASRRFEASLRELLRLVREEQCGMYLEVAGELAA